MIELINIKKAYKNQLFNNFNLQIEEGKITVILGESGSGKTTLLNIISNLTDYEGEVKNVPQNRSFVFQKSLLVQNLTVEENLKLVCPQIDVKMALKMANLEGVENYYVKQLSGGMARRVAIIRALLKDADIYFMDEPFNSLDLKNKVAFFEYVKKLKGQKTVILVTHDIFEAVSVADRIIVIKNGVCIKDHKTINANTKDELFEFILNN